MKIIKYYCPGSIPSKKNSKRVVPIKSKKTGKIKRVPISSKRYVDWHKESMEFLKNEFGLPPIPIQSCYKLIVDIYYGDFRKADNSNKVESIHDLLVDAGILKDDNWIVTGTTTQVPHYDKGMPRFLVTIWADEKHPYHEGINWKTFNVVGENHVEPDIRRYYLNSAKIIKKRDKKANQS
jgi:hypothetical protein